MRKLSFIVPVYNVASYLYKCVDSLLTQDYDDYEIILVDDGSTDGSGELCDEYEAKPTSNSSLKGRGKKPLIRVIHQENRGLSAARNAGLRVANGEYVCFVDSDDYWEPNVLGGLMEQIEHDNLDVLRFDYQNVRIKNEGVRELENEREYEVFEPNKTSRYVDTKNEVVDGETYLNTRMGYACYAVMYIIKRSLLINELESERISELEKDCLFTEGIHFEDVEWLPRMMLRAKRVNATSIIVYNYLVRQGSITKTEGNKNKILKNIEDVVSIISQYNKHLECYPNCVWLQHMRSSMVVSVLTSVAQHLYSKRIEYIKRLKELNVFPLTMEVKQGKIYMRKARLINFSSRLTVELLHFLRRRN